MPTLARTRRASLSMWLGIASVVLLPLPFLCDASGIVPLVLCRALVIVMPASLPLGLIAWATARRDLNASAHDEIEPTERGKLLCGSVCGLTGMLISALLMATMWGLWYAILIGAG